MNENSSARNSTTLTNRWRRIWERKGSVSNAFKNEEEKIKALMSINAWDSELGGTSVEMMRGTANRLNDLLEIDDDAKVLDIGCGCGLIYYVMDNPPSGIVGIDYSSSSIAIARQLVKGQFHCCPADQFPYDPGSFDGIFSIGVFIYFPDLDYTYTVLKRMVDALKPGGKALILDIPDLATKNEREALRRGSMPEAEYELEYQGLEHLYISPAWLSEKLSLLGCTMEVVSFFDESYGYDKLHYHIKFTKDG